VCHYGGVVGYFDVVVNTPRKLHSAGPTNRDYPNGGLFGNGFVSQTVITGADGKASVSYRGVEGTIANSQILASCPTCSGQARFTVFTRVPDSK